MPGDLSLPTAPSRGSVLGQDDVEAQIQAEHDARIAAEEATGQGNLGPPHDHQDLLFRGDETGHLEKFLRFRWDLDRGN